MNIGSLGWYFGATLVAIIGPPLGIRLGLPQFAAVAVGVVPAMLLMYPALSKAPDRMAFVRFVVATLLSVVIALVVGRLTSQC